MKQIIILDLPDNIDDEKLKVIILLTKFAAKGKTYTGYKEIQRAGVDLDTFLEAIGKKPNYKGAIRVDLKDVNHFVYSLLVDSSRYYLDTAIFDCEYNLFGAFKQRDPVWFTPYDEFNAYDEEKLKQLPEELQTWFINKIKKGTPTPAQELLDRTYQKYVVRGEPLPDNSFYATKNKKDDLTTSVSDTSEEGSSSQETKINSCQNDRS